MRKSVVYNFKPEQMKELIEESNSLIEVLSKIGLKSVSGSSSRTIFYKYCKENNLEEQLKELQIRSRKKQAETIIKYNKDKRAASFEECFCEESKIARHAVKRKIINEHLIEYKCAICGNTGEWNDQKLVLQLDHINGINNDNRLENLRFLCPNCHSQTKTYSGKHNMGS